MKAHFSVLTYVKGLLCFPLLIPAKYLLHFSSYEVPALIQSLAGKPIAHIACGSEYSAAVTTTGDLYMWGRGNYGRLGVGTSDDLNLPTQVSSEWLVFSRLICYRPQTKFGVR